MSSLRCCRVLLMLLFAWVLGSTTTTATGNPNSEKVLRFIEIASQDFYILWKGQNNLQILTIPANVPAVPSNNTLLLLEVVDKKAIRQEIIVVDEDPEGIIQAVRYTITNTNKTGYDYVDSEDPIDLSGLQNLTPEELEGFGDECIPTYSEIEPNAFFGLSPVCFVGVNGTYPPFIELYTCNALSFFVPPIKPEEEYTGPVIMTSQRRYPLLPEMLAGVDDYSSPCQKDDEEDEDEEDDESDESDESDEEDD